MWGRHGSASLQLHHGRWIPSLRDQGFTSACRSINSTLAPTSLIGSVGLLTPSSSTLVLWCSGSTTAFWIAACTSVAGAVGIAIFLQILSIALACQLSVYTRVSSSTCSASISWPPGVACTACSALAACTACSALVP
ncbi:hypothetical protein PO909_026304 [Leuciscus waleckii]